MAKSDFTLAFNEITEVHHLPKEVVIDALRQALVSAFRRHAEIGASQRVEAEVDPQTNQYRIFVEKEVVEGVINPRTEVELAIAQKRAPNCQIGDVVMAPEELTDQRDKAFGRVAAQATKQVILQRIREAERKSLQEEYGKRVNELVNATVQSVNGPNVTLMVGRAEAVMPIKEQIRGEILSSQQKIRVLILEVRDGSKGPQIIVSRASWMMLQKLLEYEVPEIYNRMVEIKSVAREPGKRSKVAVAALQPGIDPVGACVGMRGNRIQNVVKELHDERIDVVEWNPDPRIFISKALSPAIVTSVFLEEDIDMGNTATVIVPEDQLTQAIGREGQNARLAAKLTGWRVDIKGILEAAYTAEKELNEANPALEKITSDANFAGEVRRILDKKRQDRDLMPEEYQTLTRFVQLAEQGLLESRDQQRKLRRKTLEKARTAVPRHLFVMQLEELELEKDILSALRNRNILNVGDLMVRFNAEPEMLRQQMASAKVEADAFEAIESAVLSLVVSPEQTVSAEVVAALPDQAEALLAEAEEPMAEADPEEGDAPPAFVDIDAPKSNLSQPARDRFAAKTASIMRAAEQKSVSSKPAQPRAAAPAPEGDSKDKKGKKDRDPRDKDRSRELVYDEERGAVTAKRKRKGGRDRADWDNEPE
jgi:transcription termination/antitermination protein NusA